MVVRYFWVLLLFVSVPAVAVEDATENNAMYAGAGQAAYTLTTWGLGGIGPSYSCESEGAASVRVDTLTGQGRLVLVHGVADPDAGDASPCGRYLPDAGLAEPGLGLYSFNDCQGQGTTVTCTDTNRDQKCTFPVADRSVGREVAFLIWRASDLTFNSICPRPHNHWVSETFTLDRATGDFTLVRQPPWWATYEVRVEGTLEGQNMATVALPADADDVPAVAPLCNELVRAAIKNQCSNAAAVVETCEPGVTSPVLSGAVATKLRHVCWDRDHAIESAFLGVPHHFEYDSVGDTRDMIGFYWLGDQ